MTVPLLGTKLFLPRPGRGRVERPRLLGRLDRVTESALTLVSAPPGFGKTTLLAEWAAAIGGAPAPAVVAWLSLDDADNDPATFWTYLVAALHTAAPAVGTEAAALLRDPQPPPVETVLTSLVNDVSTVDADLVLVLDDYHVIGNPEIHGGLGFLLDHRPRQLHLVVASRSDPPLPLPRLRARGELVEVRAADLRFTTGEAASYLNDAMGLSLSADDVSALGGRTEGWIAALQLAALSITDRADASDFIAGFAGDDRYVVDYLAEEVLQRQQPDVQSFLLRTSVLERLTGPLCDAVTGEEGGKAMLERLERDNLFVVPLDDNRRWYRYHHLFADVLRARLLDEQPQDVAGLHRRASAWFEQDGDRGAAIRHAIAGNDVETAADLIELAMPATRRDRRERMLRSWLEELPREVLLRRPALCNGLAGVMLSTGSVVGVSDWLDAAEKLLQAPTDRTVAPVVVDADEHRRLPAYVAVHRAGLALATGDPAATLDFARRARELSEESDHLMRGAAAALAGLAAWSVGDLEPAEASYAASVREFEAIDHVSDVLGCARALADIQVARGRLAAAGRTLQAAAELAYRHRDRALRGTTDVHIGLAGLHVELDDLDEARRELQVARDLGELAGLPQSPFRYRVAMAQVVEAEGDVEAALGLLDEATALYNGDFSPDTRPVPAQRARVALRHGRPAEAVAYVEQAGLGIDDAPGFLREYDLVTLARTLVATATGGQDARLTDALALLGRLKGAAAERTGSLIDIGISEALAHLSGGDPAGAAASMRDVLAVAEPAGYRRTLLVEGEPMARLLEAVDARHGSSDYVRSLRASLDAAVQATSPPPSGASTLVEPLSPREHEILRLLATELRGPEIARHLVVSLNTVRTHTKNVYMKLGVNSRMAAVRRARELDLL